MEIEAAAAAIILAMPRIAQNLLALFGSKKNGLKAKPVTDIVVLMTNNNDAAI